MHRLSMICKACGRRGHTRSRCPATKAAFTFTARDLWFFAEPRTWHDIVLHFADVTRVDHHITEAILADDSDGGRGYLDWSAKLGAWYLTAAGRAFVFAVAPEALAS